ncbi:MAG: DUF6159 family protein [Planctomycetota bacterium]|nr:DUF6159 family protein [Planctomycetota bacterium]
MFFQTLSRSWEFAKISYGIIWDFKQLLVFPLASTLAAAAVLASFLLPLWGTGTLEAWLEFVSREEATQASTADQVWMYITLFLFYFCNYFVITFFNTGLVACAMKVIEGDVPSVGYGMSMAGRRLPQILGWALVSAIIGVVLKAIENAHEKAGRIVAAILGSAWTALTYFVVPVIVMDGAGPVTAIRSSIGTLKQTWGTALVGQFSLGFLSFLITLPVILICIGLGAWAAMSGSIMGLIAAIVVGVLLIVIVSAVSSAADTVFKALLYNFATGRSVPANIDTGSFRDAFAPKQ